MKIATVMCVVLVAAAAISSSRLVAAKNPSAANDFAAQVITFNYVVAGYFLAHHQWPESRQTLEDFSYSMTGPGLWLDRHHMKMFWRTVRGASFTRRGRDGVADVALTTGSGFHPLKIVYTPGSDLDVIAGSARLIR